MNLDEERTMRPHRSIAKFRRALAASGAALLLWLGAVPAQAQFFDPQNSLMLSVLREISFKHQLGLQEMRLQTARMVEQVKQFYDTYTLLRRDIEFTESLYRDFRAIENMRLHSTYAVTNFIINADRLDYWLPNMTQDLGNTAMNTQTLLSSADALRRTYDSFALSAQDDEVPDDAAARRHNALVGQEALNRALFEQALRNQQLSRTYDSLAVELYQQVVNDRNKFTEAERTQLLVESVKLRDLANTHYEKYLKMSQEIHSNELNMYDEKLDHLRSKVNWQQLNNEANRVSRIRYGFFDLAPAKLK